MRGCMELALKPAYMTVSFPKPPTKTIHPIVANTVNTKANCKEETNKQTRPVVKDNNQPTLKVTLSCHCNINGSIIFRCLWDLLAERDLTAELKGLIRRTHTIALDLKCVATVQYP